MGLALYGKDGGYTSKDQHGNRIPRHLIPELLPFLRDRKIIIAFDEDQKAKTRKDVAIAPIASVSYWKKLDLGFLSPLGKLPLARGLMITPSPWDAMP
ncbi:MAG: DUF3854 domain-containing protein [Acaryochloridaceae cyanobacterium RL_2_7]|nr:DUF3854 domain-containing protein [Acaryochloridaceae cyanobacterium RL_2_7]